MLLNPNWIFVRVHGYAWAQFLSCSNAMQTSSRKGSSCSLKKNLSQVHLWNWLLQCWYNSHFWCILSHSSELSSIGIHVPPVSIRCSVRLIRVRVLRPRSGVLLVLWVVIIWPRRRVIISITVGGRCHTCLRVGEWPYAIQCGVPADTTLDWTHWSACTRARSRAGGSRGRCWSRHGIVYWRWGWGRRWTATSLRTCREALSWAYSGTCWRQLGRRRRRRRRGRWRSAAADVTSGKALVWFVAW